MADRTLFTVLEETAATHASSPAMYQPIAGAGSRNTPKYQCWTWSQYRDAAREIACGLRSLGITHGDIVAMHSETRAEFYVADLGVVANGSIAAALYTSLPESDHVATVAKAEPRALIVEDPKTMRALQKAGVGVPAMRWVLLSGAAENDSDVLTFEGLRQLGRDAMRDDPGLFQRIRSEVRDTDYAILYMTSGATGEPKMGLVTHKAVVANIDMGPAVLPLGPEDSTLAFLPSAHIAQRVVIEFLPIRTATPVYFSEGLSKMPNELKQLRPTFLLAPPRVWERVYASISTEVKKRPPYAQKLFYGALGLGMRAARYRHEGKSVPGWIAGSLKVADRLVFSKIRARLGGRLRIAASGAAPLGRELAQFYEAIGLPLIEGYGLTEGGVATLNPLNEPRPGSIGKPLPRVEVRLGDMNELLIRSPSLFSGYYKDPASTAAVLRDGWLHTGDIAEIDKSGYVFITGRKKDLIVSSNGKKIYPARIESLFKVEPLVNHVLLVGDRQPYVTALLTINAAAAESIAGADALTANGDEAVIKAEPVVEAVDKIVRRVNSQLAPFEQIRKFRILARDFSIERGEMTPTMKVRRQQVLENYKGLVQELYPGKGDSV